MENSTEKLLYVWETNIEEVDEIKLVVKENVEEFFDRDCDLATIQRFLNKLEHPHFHYQVVYQLFATLLERDEKHIDQVGRTIKAIYNLGVTSLDEIEKGFRKIFALLPELKKMAPSAEEIYGKLRHSVMTDKKTK